jgi:hypothetical protein
MKRSFVSALVPILAPFAAIALIGCESTLDTPQGVVAVNAARAVTGTVSPGEFSAVTASGVVTLVDSAPVIQYQGNNYYLKGEGVTFPGEGTEVTITGEAAPILGQDTEGNSLFFGYYLQAGNVTLNE